jgi:hypothetical protein
MVNENTCSSILVQLINHMFIAAYEFSGLAIMNDFHVDCVSPTTMKFKLPVEVCLNFFLNDRISETRWPISTYNGSNDALTIKKSFYVVTLTTFISSHITTKYSELWTTIRKSIRLTSESEIEPLSLINDVN